MTKTTLCAAALAIAFAASASHADHTAATHRLDMRLAGNKISLNLPAAAARANASNSRSADGFFYESFEYDTNPYAWSDRTADLGWLPEGWSRISDTPGSQPLDRWYAHPFEAITSIPCADGNYAMSVLYNSEYKDEWLISPEIEVAEGQYLTFSWYSTPLYFWTVDSKHVDFDNGVFKNREIAATTKVMISVDGGDWEQLLDLSDQYLSMEYDELSTLELSSMQSAKVSLADYAGKRVKIAFRYVGVDGDSAFIDAVSVNSGVDTSDALYMSPMSSQYIGGTVDGDVLDFGAQIQPVDTEVTWWNYSDNDTYATYAWNYDDLPVTSKNPYKLSVELPIPAANAPYQFYTMPSLTAEADGSRPNTYIDADKLMAGGKPLIGSLNYGMLPFDHVSCGADIHTEEPADFGQRGVPIFGYNDATDAFWRLYTVGGREENLSHVPYAYVSGIINGIIPSEQPLVVNGAWLYAIGKFSDDAKFTCEIYSLDEDGAFDKKIASTTISGKDAKILDTRMSLYYYSLPFSFDEPVVLDEEGTEVFYAMMITGFHDEDNVEYFAPVMQVVPNPFEVCLGFYQIEFMYEGEHIVGLDYVANHENSYGEMFCAFAINLDAEYPWLSCDSDAVLVSDGSASISLKSFYGADRVKVTLADGNPLPEVLKASVSGRYNATTVTFTADSDAPTFDYDVTVSAPGVAHTLRVTNDAAGIDSIAADPSSEIIETYDVMGRTVNGDNATRGLYIIRRADGSTAKVLK